MLALALHYKLDQRVERLFDAASECRGLMTRFHRDSGLIALLLHVPTAEIEIRLTLDCARSVYEAVDRHTHAARSGVRSCGRAVSFALISTANCACWSVWCR